MFLFHVDQIKKQEQDFFQEVLMIMEMCKMRSLMRFYTQFTDVNKHDAINKFLGNKTANFNNVHMSKLNLEVKDHN